jgi:dTDP-glucose pyrophosphorylase
MVQRIIDPTDFGLVKLDKKDDIISLIEKPDPVQAAQYKTGDSYLAIRGFLAIKSNIMPFITDTQPGKNGERWLTDSLKKALLKGYQGAVHVSDSKIFDIGTPDILKELV